MNLEGVVKFGIKPANLKLHLEKISKRESLVIVTGEFSAGKSALINAFLGKKGFLPEAMQECTPVIVDLMQSDDSDLIIRYRSGEQEKVPATQGNIQYYTRNSKDYNQEILAVSIPVQSPYLMSKMHLIDTPGTSTIFKEHEQITEYMIKQADIVIYALNKSLAESDFVHIQKVLTYTDEVIFIITHIDEVTGEEQLSQGKYKSMDTIARFVGAAKDSLMTNCGIEQPEIYVVGSKEAFNDDTYIAPIRQCIHDYVEMNGLEMTQKRVQKQLAVIFGQRLQKLQQEVDFFASNLDIDKVEVQKKLQVLEKKADRSSVKQQERILKAKEVLERQKERASTAVRKMIEDKKILADERLRNLKELSSENVDKILTELNKDLGEQLRSIIERNISEYNEFVFQEISLNLQEILKEVDVKIDSRFAPPKLENLDQEPGGFQYSFREIEQMIENCIRDMQLLEDEIGNTEQEKEQLKDSIGQTEQELQNLRTSIKELGPYIPLYEEKIENGGGQTGAIVGRIIGEAIDLALLLIPVGAAEKGTTTVLRAADMAKDAVKTASYVELATRGARQVLENGNKVKELGQKVLAARAEAKQVVRESSDNFSKLGDMLDFLSLGHWGEKLGQALGESIKSTSIVMVENQKNRKIWESKREAMEYEMNLIRQQQRELQRAYENADSIREKRQKITQMEKIKQQYEAMALQLEQRSKQIQEESLKLAGERHYSENITRIYNEELLNILNNTIYVLEQAADKIIAKSIEAQDERLQELTDQMTILAKRKEEIEVAIQQKRELIEELKDYQQWIDQWVQEYAVS